MLDENCENYHRCLEILVMEAFVEIGGRSTSCLPCCKDCNMCIEVKEDE